MLSIESLPDIGSANWTSVETDKGLIILLYSVTADKMTVQIVFTTYRLLEQLPNCKKFFKRHPEGVLAEIDYTKGFLSQFCYGCLGFSDANRSFHPVLFDVNLTKNSYSARQLLISFQNSLNRFSSVTCAQVLKDGGSALSSAALLLGMRELSCLSHMI